MDWEDFQNDHHRPHVFIVSIETTRPGHALSKADFDRLIAGFGAIGNYAIKTVGTTIQIAFERDADANQLAAILRPTQTTREAEWASKSLASVDGVTYRRFADIIKRVRLTARRRRFTPR